MNESLMYINDRVSSWRGPVASVPVRGSRLQKKVRVETSGGLCLGRVQACIGGTLTAIRDMLSRIFEELCPV